MEINEYLEIKQTIQRKLIDYLDYDDNMEENFRNLIDFFQKHKLHEDRQEIDEFLHLISNICNYHLRRTNFYKKIEGILTFFKSQIQKYLSNSEIFDIFIENKRIVLFLIQNQMITIDSYIVSQLRLSYYSRLNINYLFNEIKPFISDEIKKIDIIDPQYLKNYEENRKIGENESFICQLIRNDSIDEFISYFNKNEISVNSIIPDSI